MHIKFEHILLFYIRYVIEHQFSQLHGR